MSWHFDIVAYFLDWVWAALTESDEIDGKSKKWWRYVSIVEGGMRNNAEFRTPGLSESVGQNDGIDGVFSFGLWSYVDYPLKSFS